MKRTDINSLREKAKIARLVNKFIELDADVSEDECDNTTDADTTQSW